MELGGRGVEAGEENCKNGKSVLRAIHQPLTDEESHFTWIMRAISAKQNRSKEGDKHFEISASETKRKYNRDITCISQTLQAHKYLMYGDKEYINVKQFHYKRVFLE